MKRKIIVFVVVHPINLGITRDRRAESSSRGLFYLGFIVPIQIKRLGLNAAMLLSLHFSPPDPTSDGLEGLLILRLRSLTSAAMLDARCCHFPFCRFGLYITAVKRTWRRSLFWCSSGGVLFWNSCPALEENSKERQQEHGRICDRRTQKEKNTSPSILTAGASLFLCIFSFSLSHHHHHHQIRSNLSFVTRSRRRGPPCL